MNKDQSRQDANQAAARVVGETAARNSDALPPDVEAAWAKWSAGIAGVDERGWALLRAAFEVAAEAAQTRH
ncbi:MAG: hypothetical protein ABSD28_21375 [Tepidisphaeraceae bacterium]|jgi:hypothetical protein